MFEDFIIRALLAGCVLALVTGPLGCFIIWKKMAYFGDTLGHSALLGVALAVALKIEAMIGIFIIAAAISMLVIALRRTKLFSNDTALGILSHSALALGLIAISVSDNSGAIQLNSLLFGDILAVSNADVWTSFGVAIIIGIILYKLWDSLIATTISEEIAMVEGLGTKWGELIFMILCSGLIAVAMKITGILLISALLVIPAAAARIFARSPEQMAIIASLAAVLSIICGLMISLKLDLPSGPAIITAAAMLLLGAIVVRKVRGS